MYKGATGPEFRGAGTPCRGVLAAQARRPRRRGPPNAAIAASILSRSSINVWRMSTIAPPAYHSRKTRGAQNALTRPRNQNAFHPTSAPLFRRPLHNFRDPPITTNPRPQVQHLASTPPRSRPRILRANCETYHTPPGPLRQLTRPVISATNELSTRTLRPAPPPEAAGPAI